MSYFSLADTIRMLTYGCFYPQGLLQRGNNSGEELHHREPLKAHV